MVKKCATVYRNQRFRKINDTIYEARTRAMQIRPFIPQRRLVDLLKALRLSPSPNDYLKPLSLYDVFSHTMSKYITLKEYAQQQGVTERTVYRWMKNNDIEVKKVKGVWRVKIDEESADKDEIMLTLKSENCHLLQQIEYLQHRLEQAQGTIDAMQQRSDTIIMQLTMQLEKQTLMLEDLRHRSLWRRVKMAFARGN